MNEREKAHAELQHALAALADIPVGGPMSEARINHRVRVRRGLDRKPAASAALDCACQVLERFGISHYRRPPSDCARHLAKLAPVLLDVYLDAKGVE